MEKIKLNDYRLGREIKLIRRHTLSESYFNSIDTTHLDAMNWKKYIEDNGRYLIDSDGNK